MEVDVVEVVLRGLHLAGVLFIKVPEPQDILLPEECVVIHLDLRVQRDQRLPAGDHQRIDLEQGTVGLDEEPVEVRDQRGERSGKGSGETETAGDLPALTGPDPGERIDQHPDDLLGVSGRDLLDVHSPGPAGDDHDLGGGAVRKDGEIQLLGDIQALLHQDLPDRFSLRSRLGGDQRPAQNGLCGAPHLVKGPRDPDPAALAAAACMDLGLDHHRELAELFSRRAGLVGIRCDMSLRNRDAAIPEQFLGLIFVDLHGTAFVV